MKKKEEIVLIGGGGHCKACIDVIECEGKYSILGIIDLPEKRGQKICGYQIFETDDNLYKIVEEYKYFLITIGFINSPQLRIDKYKKIKDMGGVFPIIISPNSYVSTHSDIDEGTIVMHGSVINASSKIGKNCIINSLALIEHDVIIGNHTHVSTGARINGSCNIGNNCFIGSGSILNQGVKVHSDTIIGSGSIVRKSINESGVYAGNPVKKIS